MSFDAVVRQVESAAAHLGKTSRETSGWADEQRQTFDRERLTPLAEVSPRLLEALRKAQQACRDAERLQAD